MVSRCELLVALSVLFNELISLGCSWAAAALAYGDRQSPQALDCWGSYSPQALPSLNLLPCFPTLLHISKVDPEI